MHSPSWRLAGIDIAWRAGNASALAFGQLQGNLLTVEQVLHQPFTATAMGQLLLTEAVQGVAIDGPTVIVNETGMRDCERAIASRYGRRGVACYPANLTLWSDCQSLLLSQWLLQHGFAHGGVLSSAPQQQPWQIECYPHAALLEIFQLPYRLAYKKGSVAQRRSGQQHFAERLLSLETSQNQALIELRFAPSVRHQLLDIQAIGQLRGAALKANEDGLDALVCLVIAAYHQCHLSHTFGDHDHGFIVVPRVPTS